MTRDPTPRVARLWRTQVGRVVLFFSRSEVPRRVRRFVPWAANHAAIAQRRLRASAKAGTSSPGKPAKVRDDARGQRGHRLAGAWPERRLLEAVVGSWDNRRSGRLVPWHDVWGGGGGTLSLLWPWLLVSEGGGWSQGKQRTTLVQGTVGWRISGGEINKLPPLGWRLDEAPSAVEASDGHRWWSKTGGQDRTGPAPSAKPRRLPMSMS